MSGKLEKQNTWSGSESARAVRFSMEPESADHVFFLSNRAFLTLGS